MLCLQAQEEGVDIPNVDEDKRLLMINWQQSMSYAINLRNQLQLSIPIVMQRKMYNFTNMETGQPYTPPLGYENLFHPQGTLIGLGDVQFGAQHFVFLPNLVVGMELGARLPTGSRRFDEYSLLEYHQPLTSGTVIPTGRMIFFSRGDVHGILSNVTCQVPFMQNELGYRFGNVVGGDVGYWRRRNGSTILTQIAVLHEEPHQWNAATIPYSHRTFVRAGFMMTQQIDEKFEAMLRMDSQIFRKVWDRDTQPQMDIRTTPVLNIGLTWL